MQQSRKKWMVPLVVLLLLAAGFVFLMLMDIPSPQRAIEQPANLSALPLTLV